MSFALAVGAVALVLRLGVEAGFQTYLDTAQAAAHGRIMGALEALPTADPGWDRDRVADLGRQALDQGLVLTLNDAEGRSVWSARADAPAAVDAVFSTLETRLKSRVPWAKGRWEPWDHPVSAPGGHQATMVLEVFQPRRLGASDLAFLQGLDALLGWVALAGILIGTVAGLLTARGLVHSLSNLQTLTLRLGTGDYRRPPPSPTLFTEIRSLELGLGVLADRLSYLHSLRETAGANTAHELRTPLANLEAQLEALEDGILPATAERFATLGGEVRRLKALVQAWEDIEVARTPQAASKRCDHPAEVVRNAVESFQARAAGRTQDLTWKVDAPAHPLPLASEDLGRIVINLVENAHRHTPNGGRIKVRLNSGPLGTQLIVDDDGPGIPLEHREGVFDRFYRVDSSRSRATGGMGLGLSLVKALVEESGGTVVAEANDWGGCRIRIQWGELPR